MAHKDNKNSDGKTAGEDSLKEKFGFGDDKEIRKQIHSTRGTYNPENRKMKSKNSGMRVDPIVDRFSRKNRETITENNLDEESQTKGSCSPRKRPRIDERTRTQQEAVAAIVNDEHMLFGLYVAALLRKLPKKEELAAREKIVNILMAAKRQVAEERSMSLKMGG